MKKIPWYKSILYREIGLLIISFLVILSLIITTLVVQSTRSMQDILDKLEKETTTHVSTIIESNLSKAQQILNLHMGTLSKDLVSVDDITQRERYFVTILEQYDDIAMTFIGLPDGSFYGARRIPDGTLQIARNDHTTQGHSEYYAVSESGESLELLQVFENFDPRVRPWYEKALQQKGIAYSDLYSHFVFQEPTITASLAYYEEDELVGVFGADYLMSWLGDALSQLVIGENGQIIIVDNDNHLIASSVQEDIFDVETGVAVPKNVEDSQLEVFKKGLENYTNTDRAHRFLYQGDRYTLTASNLGLTELEWDVYFIIKESDFLSGFQVALTGILISTLLLACVFVIIMILSNRKYVRPILKLNQAALSLVEGEYREVPEGKSDDEINEHIHIFNQMGYQISHQMEILTNEVKKQTRAYEMAAAEAQEANEAKSRFLATMSHELRTPLNSFVGMIELLKMTQLDKEQHEYTQLAEKSSYTLMNLINDVLDFSKIEANQIELERIPFNISELTDRVQAVTMPLIKKQGNKFNLTINETVPTAVIGDPIKLSQILINLVSNATKFTHNGDIQLSIAHEPSHQSKSESSSPHLVFTVTDSGIGMPQDKLDQIFKPFVQVNNTTTRKYGGTGLGLSISNRLVDLMNGTIRVESQEGKGSRFTVTIPLEPFETNEQEERMPLTTLIPAGPQQDIKVLLVEDDSANVFFVQAFGKKEGWHTDVATDGKMAVEKSATRQYHLILMDINLPELDGLEVTRIIRREGLNKNTPILAMTANVLSGTEAQCLEAGMDAYLAKPFKVIQLRELVKKLLMTRD